MDGGYILLVLVLFGCLFGCYSAYIVREYQIAKPLGMQTLLGKVIAELTKYFFVSTMINAVGSAIAIFSINAPLGDHTRFLLSVIFTVASYVAFMFNLLGFGTCLLTRYACVYHSVFVASLDEDQVILWINRFILVASFSIPLIEYTCLTRMEDSVVYFLFSKHHQSPKDVEKLKIILGLTDALIMIILQLRLEYDKAQFGDKSCLSFLLGLRSRMSGNDIPAIQIGDPNSLPVIVNHKVLWIIVIIVGIIPGTILYVRCFDGEGAEAEVQVLPRGNGGEQEHLTSGPLQEKYKQSRHPKLCQHQVSQMWKTNSHL